MDELVSLMPEKTKNRIGAMFKSYAIKMAPIDTEEMRSKIDFKVEGDTITLFCDDPKAKDIEWGTPPEPTGIWGDEAEGLRQWSKSHNANPWEIISYIEKHGIKVGTETEPLHITSYGRDSYRPFLRPAIYLNLAEMMKIIVADMDGMEIK